MKNLIIYFLVLLALSALKGCNNSNDPIPVSETISGNWIGKYGNGSKIPEFFWGFEISPDGKITELDSDGVKTGDGIWTKIGEKFVCTYHNDTPYNATYSMRGTFSPADGSIKGTWGFINNETNGGTFELFKQKPVRR